MTLPTRARIAGILAICLLMLGAPGALASPLYSPDAAIRLGSGSYVGDGIRNNDATGQSVFNSGLVGQKLTFWIRITNWGALTDSFKVKRSAGFTDAYRVRYYDAANNDVTGQVTTGTFTTPALATDGAGQYAMRATVKIKSWASPCSFTSRLITVASVGNSALKDAVRFTAALAPGCPDITLSPGVLAPVNFYEFDFGSSSNGDTQTFTLKNEGTGPSDELGLSIGGFGFALVNDNCSGAILPAGGSCTFETTVTGCPESLLLGTFGITGGVPPTTQYLTLALDALCVT